MVGYSQPNSLQGPTQKNKLPPLSPLPSFLSLTPAGATYWRNPSGQKRAREPVDIVYNDPAFWGTEDDFEGQMDDILYIP